MTSCSTHLENERKALHLYPLSKTADQYVYSVNNEQIFRSDAPSLSEILTNHPASVTIPFTLSSSFNRTLLYGNSAPLQSVVTESGLPLRVWQYDGTDILSSSQTAKLQSGPGPFVTVLGQPEQIAVPEVRALWETGVFNENILNLRFSRPLSRKMNVSVFSDYRSFSGTRFNHERNDIIDIYRNLTPDTTALINTGYNPQTKEHVVGTQVRYGSSSERSFYGSFSYGDLRNEFALDREAERSDRLTWGNLNRYVYNIESGFGIYDLKPFLIDLNAKNHHNKSYFTSPDTLGKTVAEFVKTSDAEGTVGLGVTFGSNDTAGIRHTLLRRRRGFSGKDEDLTYENKPELFYKRSFTLGPVESYLCGSAGYTFMNTDEELFSSPYISASLDLNLKNQEISLYFKKDALSVYPQLQSQYISPYADQYNQMGAELYLSHNFIGLLMGYQYVYGIDPFTVSISWPQNTAPYAQPNHVVLIAPQLHFKSFSLSTRAMISDTKPTIKLSGEASYVFNPRGTSAFFETTLGLDYWSARDRVTFAGLNSWSDPIYNLNLTLGAHISSFRLFYKVDNLLNRKNAWVPGYFSPGITFRWGLNWFIQR